MHPGLEKDIVEEVVNYGSSRLSAAYILASIARH
jgi:hypothetical protein